MFILEVALDYAKRGFATLPLYGIMAAGCACGNPDCASPGKHPNIANGLKAASNDPDVIPHIFKNKFGNIGIATGPVSGIFVVDIDGPAGEASLENFPALPETLSSSTGRGRHLFFRYPIRKVYTRAGKFAPGLDIRGDGGYVVAPPSMHYSGVAYQFMNDAAIAEAPDWLLDIICQETSARATQNYTFTQTHNDDSKWSIDDVREMLSYIDPDTDYDEWIEIGMGLHCDGYPLAVWDEWSKRGNKYKPGVTISHWRSFKPDAGISFGTVVHKAALNGWKPREIKHDLSIDDHPAREFLLRVKAGEVAISGIPSKTPPENKKPLFDPLKIPGLVGDTVREIVATSQKPQPELALLNTLSALGAIFGRRYASPMDTRSNIYTVGIAVTAAGKDHSRRFIKRLLNDAKLDQFLGEDTIISGAGLISSIAKRPSQIMHLDEFGMLLEAITDQRGAHYMKAASKVITEMYSTSSGVFFGGQYADKKTEAMRIPAPNLCIYGTTTPEKYIASLSRSTVASGELNRFIVIRPQIDRPTRRRYLGASSPSGQLVGQWAALVADCGPIINHSTIHPDPTSVNWPGLEDRIWDMGLWEDDQIGAYEEAGPLWGRYRENVIKIAMILAITRNPIVPIMEDTDLDIAEAIVRQAIEYAITIARDHMADSQHEKDCQDIVAAIKKEGGSIKRSVLYNATRRMDMKQRNMAIDSLIEQDRIFISETDSAGTHKRAKVYSIK